MANSHLYGVILAGGSGTRFWPLSREYFPKQLLRLLGKETLIQQTIRRVLHCVPAKQICIVTNRIHEESIKFQLRQWKDTLRENLILEPEGRNTAPAIGMAALKLIREDPKAILLVLPADHVIKPVAKFRQAVAIGARLAADGYLVTFGIRPTKPETGYGYIHPNLRSRLGNRAEVSGYKVARFVEKPDEVTAQRYLRKGNVFWNSGIFMWQASTILHEFQAYQPALFRALRSIDKQAEAGQSLSQLATRYKRLKAISIDHAVMERSSRAAVVPVDFFWSDVGSWGHLDDVTPRNDGGNVLAGNIMDLGSTDSVLFADQRLVATIGLSNMVVVDTPDATLVCPKSRSQDVKNVVASLRKRGAPEHLDHRTVFRPWGSYTVLEENRGYKVKRVSVAPGGRLSLQMHDQRSEHWVVISGRARVTRGEEVFDLDVGQSTGIPKQTMHRLETLGKKPLEIIEVQNGPYLGEDDIVRFDDKYGREAKPKASRG